MQWSRIFLLLLLLTVTTVNSQNNVQKYVVQKDLINFFRPGQFSIFDGNEKELLFRVKSYISFWHRIEIFDATTKQLIGRLLSDWTWFLYQAKFSILDPTSNKWIDGQIQKKLSFYVDQYLIEWNDRKIMMETKIASFTSEFRDENQQILARYRMRWSSLIWSNKYDLEIYSNEFPESLYILALAAKDHTDSKSTGQRHSKSKSKIKLH